MCIPPETLNASAIPLQIVVSSAKCDLTVLPGVNGVQDVCSTLSCCPPKQARPCHDTWKMLAAMLSITLYRFISWYLIAIHYYMAFLAMTLTQPCGHDSSAVCYELHVANTCHYCRQTLASTWTLSYLQDIHGEHYLLREVTCLHCLCTGSTGTML